MLVPFALCGPPEVSAVPPIAIRRPRPATYPARLVLAVLAAVSLTACGAGSAIVPAPYPHQLAQVRIAAAGDVIPHEAVKAAAAAEGPGAQGWAALLSHVADIFQSADIGFVNMETPVAPDHSQGTHAFLFNAPVDLPTALKLSGIKIVSFANNHAMDQGWAGFA
ncbi:MAG TPA: CapA family protein, partial [Terracidiphilus sp.]|nr:CapA family protein [Terracidiphilus sp.]